MQTAARPACSRSGSVADCRGKQANHASRAIPAGGGNLPSPPVWDSADDTVHTLRTAVSADAVPEMRVPGTRVFRYSGEGPFKESCRRIHIVIANLEKAFNNATGALKIVAMRRHAPSAGKPATAPEDAGSTGRSRAHRREWLAGWRYRRSSAASGRPCRCKCRVAANGIRLPGLLFDMTLLTQGKQAFSRG